MIGEKEVRVLLLAVIATAVGAGPCAARFVDTDGLAFVTSSAPCRSPAAAASSSPSSFAHPHTTWRASSPPRQQQQQQQRRRRHVQDETLTPRRFLRSRCSRGWECPVALSSWSAAGEAAAAAATLPEFPSPGRRRRSRAGQPQQQQQRPVFAASSGLQEPLERVSADSSSYHGDDSSLHHRAVAVAGRRGRPSPRGGSGGGGASATGAPAAPLPARGGAAYGEGEGQAAAGGYAAMLRPEEDEEEEGEDGREEEEYDDYDPDFEGDDIDIYLPGGMGAGLRPGFKPRKSKPPVMWSKAVSNNKRFRVVLAGREDLDEAGALCIKVFFGQPDSPWKAAQLRQLLHEQRQDLESRCSRKESVMFKAIDTRRKDAMVGFVEVSETSGSKYGMGSGVPVADTRPVVSNLAVDPRARRSGIGSALMEACEDLVNTWHFEEIILQVEEDNEAALAFYGGKGFHTLFVDRAARRYDTTGFLLQNVRTSKLTMRKALLNSSEKKPRNKTGDTTLGDHVSHLFGLLTKPFVGQPPPSTRLPGRSAASVENLFGPPGGSGGSGVRRRRSGGGARSTSSRTSGGRVGSGSSGSRSGGGGDGGGAVGGGSRSSGSIEGSDTRTSSSGLDDPSSSFSPYSSSSEEAPPVRLRRTTPDRRRW